MVYGHPRVKLSLVYYVYILQSLEDRKLYIGFTKDLRERLKDHNSGGTRSTAVRRPFKLLYYEAHISEIDARRREKYFKTDKGKSSLKQMLRDGLRRYAGEILLEFA